MSEDITDETLAFIEDYLKVMPENYQYRLVISELFEAYKSSKQSKWTRVSDGLPSEDKQIEVAFFVKPYEWQTGMFSPSKFNDGLGYVFERHDHLTDDRYHAVEDVKYWMSLEPLPQPPKPGFLSEDVVAGSLHALNKPSDKEK